MHGFPAERLGADALRGLSPERKRAFYSWIEAMTREADNEDGPDFAAWLRLHETVPGDVTWVFTDSGNGDLLGTASLVKRDRDTEADTGGWCLGGVNVVRERRREGIGRAIVRFVERKLQARACASGQAVPVKLVATYAPAIRLYEAFGFRRAPGESDVYARVFGAEGERE